MEKTLLAQVDWTLLRTRARREASELIVQHHAEWDADAMDRLAGNVEKFYPDAAQYRAILANEIQARAIALRALRLSLNPKRT